VEEVAAIQQEISLRWHERLGIGRHLTPRDVLVRS
jgi:hypothetical protein